MKKALVVIDMQKDFLGGALKNPDAQKIVPLIVEEILQFEGTVYATKDTHGENYMDTAEGKKLPVPHCIKGTDGHEIDEDIQAALDKRSAVILEKPTFGFLDWSVLKGYDEITLVGTCTDICVVSNALILKATYPETIIKTIPALCAGTSKENHDAAIAVMRCCQVEIVE